MTISFSDFILFVGIILGIWGIIEFFIAIFLENKYNIWNRFKRWKAKRKNKIVKVRISFRFETKSAFDELKKIFKNKFKDVESKKDNDIVLDFTSDIHSVKITKDSSDNTIFIEFYRIGWGIKELKDLIQDEVISKLNDLLLQFSHFFLHFPIIFYNLHPSKKFFKNKIRKKFANHFLSRIIGHHNRP